MIAVRWYPRYGLSYRDAEELLAERGAEVDHVTVYRWVQRFTPLHRRRAPVPTLPRGTAVRRSPSSHSPSRRSSTAAKEGTRTPEKHECSGQRPEQCSVELLASYSHSAQAADLRLCRTVALSSPVCPETEGEV